MPEIGGIFHPAPPSQEYLVRLVRAQYQIWREEKEAKEPKWVVENIRFEHDPHWRDYPMFFSIQGIRDNPNLAWMLTRVAFAASASAPYLVRLIT